MPLTFQSSFWPPHSILSYATQALPVAILIEVCCVLVGGVLGFGYIPAAIDRLGYISAIDTPAKNQESIASWGYHPC